MLVGLLAFELHLVSQGADLDSVRHCTYFDGLFEDYVHRIVGKVFLSWGSLRNIIRVESFSVVFKLDFGDLFLFILSVLFDIFAHLHFYSLPHNLFGISFLVLLTVLNLFLLLLFLLPRLFALLVQCFQPQEKLGRKCDQQSYDQTICHDWRDKVINQWPDSRPIEHAGNDNDDQVVVHEGSFFVGVPLEDQPHNVVECCAQNQGVRERGRVGLRIVKGVHQEQHLELSEWIARGVADGRRDGVKAIDGDGVSWDGEDRVMNAQIWLAAVHVRTAPIRPTCYLCHLDLLDNTWAIYYR